MPQIIKEVIASPILLGKGLAFLFLFSTLMLWSALPVAAHLGPEVEFLGSTEGAQSTHVGGSYYNYTNLVRVTLIISDEAHVLTSGALVAVMWDSNQGSELISESGVQVHVYGEYLATQQGPAIVSLEVPLPVHYLQREAAPEETEQTSVPFVDLWLVVLGAGILIGGVSIFALKWIKFSRGK